MTSLAEPLLAPLEELGAPPGALCRLEGHGWWLGVQAPVLGCLGLNAGCITVDSVTNLTALCSTFLIYTMSISNNTQFPGFF